MTNSLHRHNLKSSIERVYFHNPYIVKTSCVDIIQYIERFTRFGLYPNVQMFGVSNSRNWERLVRNYLEEAHSFIDLQRRTIAAVEKYLGNDLEAERKAIIEPIPVDSSIIKELRTQIHHEDAALINIVASYGGGQNYPAIPMVMIRRDWFKKKEEIDRVDEVMNNLGLLWHVFGTHCDHFVNSSNKIGNMLFEHLGYPTIPPPPNKSR